MECPTRNVTELVRMKRMRRRKPLSVLPKNRRTNTFQRDRHCWPLALSVLLLRVLQKRDALADSGARHQDGPKLELPREAQVQ